MEELKQVKLKNGKFTLEGKVIEVEPLKLVALDVDLETLYSVESQLESLSEVNIKLIDITIEKTKEISYLLDKRKSLLKQFEEFRPQFANAYVAGKPLILEDTNTDWGGSHFSYDHYPVLY